MADDVFPAPMFLNGMFRRVADQALGVAHFVHHLVTGIDAGGAAYAFILQAVANVDSGWADLNTDFTVNAIPLAD